MHQAKEKLMAGSAVMETSAPPGREAPPEKKDHAGAVEGEWTKVRKLAARQLERFMSLEPKVLRGDDPGAIHDMRVASRRLQQVIDLLYPPPAGGEIRKLRRVIQRCRRSLSEVRNCDVLLKSVSARLARKRVARREEWEAVEIYLHQRRTKNFEKALRKISKMNMAAFYVHLKGHLTLNGNKRHTTPHHLLESSIQGHAPAQFYDRFGGMLAQVAEAFENQIEQSFADPRATVIHGARIATKRIRYLIEVVREMGVPGSDEWLAWLRHLQRHLGEWHDLEVLEQVMIEMVARPEFLRDQLHLAMGVEKLILRNRAAKKVLEEKYLLMARDSSELRRLKDWVAYLVDSPSPPVAKA
ncbi:MAG TPA: CHAD domain-containing protein [Terriglobia bacterium]|nr:CHAD domain-containing protein [Terriglobia bacterium]